MTEPIYFSKIEFHETIGFNDISSIIFLNLPERELSYQVFKFEYQSPVIQGIEIEETNNKPCYYNTGYHAKWVSSDKTNFKSILFKDDTEKEKILFSYGLKLTEEQMRNLLPLCNALNFERYRNKKMATNNKGYCGYRDEVKLKFKGTTDSYIPLIELPMDFYYDEEHIWPNEKLYRYIIKYIFSNQKELKNRYTPYGGLSSFE